MFRSFVVAAAVGAAAFVVSPAAAQSDFNWTGFYAGVHGGAGYGDASAAAGIDGEVEGCLFGCQIFPFSQSSEVDFSDLGVLGGAQVGADYALGNFVIGVKADISATDMDGSGSLADFSIGPFLNGNVGPFDIFNAGVATDIDWMATVRGRAGVTGPKGSLLYVTGGLAIAEVESTLSYTGLFSDGSTSQTDTRYGWTVGIGGEAPITKHLTFGLEYLYTDLGSWNIFGAGGDFGPGISCNLAGCFGAEGSYDINAETSLKVHTWRAAVSYKFSGLTGN